MTPSPFGRHQYCSLKIARSLLDAIEGENGPAVVLQEIDWVISDDTVVRPDVLVVCGGIPERHVTEAPAVVVEVISPSTADKDRNDKLRLYEENGIEYYLIVDPHDNVLTAHGRNEQSSFVRVEPVDTLEFTICKNCHITLKTASFFE